MASTGHVSDSNSSEVDLIHISKEDNTKEPQQSAPALSHRFRGSPQKPGDQMLERSSAEEENKIAVMVKGPSRPWEYQPFFEDNTVDAVLEETEGPGEEIWYNVEYEDGRKELVSFDDLLKLRNGQNALQLYHIGNDDSKSATSSRSSLEPSMSSSTGKRTRAKRAIHGYVDITSTALDSEEEGLSKDRSVVKRRRLAKRGVSLRSSNSTHHNSRVGSRLSTRPPSSEAHYDEISDSESDPPRKRVALANKSASTRLTRSNARPIIRLKHKAFEEDEEIDELAGDKQTESDNSGSVHYVPKRKSQSNNNRRGRPLSRGKRGRQRLDFDESESSPERQEPTRRSGRSRAIKSMKEGDMDVEIYADEVSVENAPKIISIREIYQPMSKQSRFYLFHNAACDVCGGVGSDSNKGTSPLIPCQGCTSSIHKVCLGYRSAREPMVTKIGHENFVMQCRRCIGVVVRKDSSAPQLDRCQGCNKPGASCAAFSTKKTSKQEERLREENGGDDPITEVSNTLVNNADNMLFRCKSCQRAWHVDHLPPLSDKSETPEHVDDLRDKRFKEYAPEWQCKECLEVPSKVQGLVAWRLTVEESYVAGDTVDTFREDEKEYLVKWEDKSYFKCTWMPGAWVWGVTSALMRRAFFRRDEGANQLPKRTAEEAIPEEFLRVEIVFDVSYDNGFRPHSKASDMAHIKDVAQVLVKFQGLGYDQAVWEDPPLPGDADRWSDFAAAYNEYVAGKYFKQQPVAVMKERIDKFRSLNFERNIELENQPSALTGGQIMPYQMEGLNWLLYNFHQKKNVILADEMGLGKTIQIIALIASLVMDKPKCWPFLVVTPNSTCPNWRREIKKWAPGLRVVAYYGVKHARDMAMEYELFPERGSDMRAHVVVTSYEAPVDDHSRSFFRRIKWAGMIVDEGQRLKNDENLLYGALKALKVPFQVLLTGTPLQNNKRELFNLLQFLDASMNAAKLDEKYAELTKENLPELHDLIRPFFLRRTKLQVLKFLPPMAQVILPVTMSVVQKKLYKSILAKNPDLIRSIFGQRQTVLRPAEQGNLNNILMQLRKCLCHPFLYSSAIEERSVNEKALHRNLVDASSKFQLLEIMLPKLRERGHRVLLFSQFLVQLDLVEDFLNGLDLPFQRLDGSIGSLEKQKRIDAFNAPDSPLFAFLLSTRAGGVGINLATADTVIIMDPDFNPHQDIQALSRAHRIGQKKKVLVFQLMTKDSAEEKIVQIGRKKMALDQALIESMDAEDDVGVDLESILKHGAEALFNDDDRNDIHYDSASVDKLLDRTLVENNNADEEKTAESQFSFARVWANDEGALTENVDDTDAESSTPNLSVWDKILEQRAADAASEAARKMQTFGRGKRARQAIDYQRATRVPDDDAVPSSPHKLKSRRRPRESGSDLDFAAAGESDEDADSDDDMQVRHDDLELRPQQHRSKGILAGTGQGTKGKTSFQSCQNPEKPASSGLEQRGLASKSGRTITLNFGKFAKRQLGAQSPVPGKRREVAFKNLPNKAKGVLSSPKQLIFPGKKQSSKEQPVAGYDARCPVQSHDNSKQILASPNMTSGKEQTVAVQDPQQTPKTPTQIPLVTRNYVSAVQRLRRATSPNGRILEEGGQQYAANSSQHLSGAGKFRTESSNIRHYEKPDFRTLPHSIGHETQLVTTEGTFQQRSESPFQHVPRHFGINQASQEAPMHTGRGSTAQHEPRNGHIEERNSAQPPNSSQCCHICDDVHVSGQCRTNAVRNGRCVICRIAHFGSSPACPTLRSEVQIRLMLDGLKASEQPREEVDVVRAFLRNELLERSLNKKNRGAA